MNKDNAQMPATDPRRAAFTDIIPPAEWIVVIDGTMHVHDPDESMRWPRSVYQKLLDLTKQKNLSVVFVGGRLDAEHARKMFTSFGQTNFPWIACIDDRDNAVPFMIYARFIIANQSPLAHFPASNGVPTCQIEVDPQIPRQDFGESHTVLGPDEAHKVFEWVDKQL